MGKQQPGVRAQEIKIVRAPLAPAVAPPSGTPPTPATQGTPPATPAPTATLDLSGFSANQLRRMLQELRSQRQELADRRQTIGPSYEGASGANREGIGARLDQLDRGIAGYEAEIVRVGRAYATKAAGESNTTSNPTIPFNYVRRDQATGMTFGFSFMTAIVVFVAARRMFRRNYYGAASQRQQQPNLIASNERLERIEQAVDAIAVEVERVSENQRFMTRLMTETQLGDTIKDVRKSTELAKSAAENSG
jgi:hypothetical protein